MKKLLIVVLSVLLGACASISPVSKETVVAVVKTDGYVATFYDSKCSSEKVLAFTGPLPENVKNGSVIFSDGSKRQFCYITDAGVAAILDEEGDQGYVELKK